MPRMHSLEPVLIQELRDLLDAEQQLTRALPKLAKAAFSDELRRAFKAEHYEIASYGTVCAHARTIGRDEIASMLEKTLEEEKEADKIVYLSGSGLPAGLGTGRDIPGVSPEPKLEARSLSGSETPCLILRRPGGRCRLGHWAPTPRRNARARSGAPWAVRSLHRESGRTLGKTCPSDALSSRRRRYPLKEISQ